MTSRAAPFLIAAQEAANDSLQDVTSKPRDTTVRPLSHITISSKLRTSHRCEPANDDYDNPVMQCAKAAKWFLQELICLSQACRNGPIRRETIAVFTRRHLWLLSEQAFWMTLIAELKRSIRFQTKKPKEGVLVITLNKDQLLFIVEECFTALLLESGDVRKAASVLLSRKRYTDMFADESESDLRDRLQAFGIGGSPIMFLAILSVLSDRQSATLVRFPFHR